MKPIYAILILLSLISMMTPCCIEAEGTKQVMPNSTNGTGLIVSTTTTFPLGNVGSYLNCPVDDRIFFHISSYTTELLYYGFNWETLSPATPITHYTDVYMNVYDPTGAAVPGSPFLLNSTAGQAGFISSYIQGIQGPKIGGAPTTGYVPGVFTPYMNGDYYVTFYRSDNGGVTHITGGESMLSKYFDLTVAAGNVRETGRVHCNEWAFSVYNPASNDIQDPLTPTNAEFFGYTADSCTIKVSFPATGFEPLSYIVAFNSFGCQNTGNWPSDRQSIVLQNLVAPYLTGGYLVFLNPPDPTVYPTSSIPNPPVLLNPVISGCPPGPYNVRFSAPQTGDYYLLFDLNGITGYQPNSADIWIELDNKSPGIITYSWNGKDGLGNQVPANTSFPITFSFRKGRINIPIYDDELNINGFNVAGVAPAGAVSTNPTLYWDDTLLYNAGTDCSSNNNNYTGSGYDNSILGVTPGPVGNPTIGRAWNGNGNPTNAIPAPAVYYSGTPNDSDNVQCNDFGNARLINTWAWGIVLNSTQTLTLTCVDVSGTVWDDADGSAKGTFTNIRTNSEQGTNAGNDLYASLVDPVSGDVVASVAVSATGTYTFNNVPVNSSGMEIYLSTSSGTVGSLPPATGLPSNWVNTSPLIHTFNAGTANVTGIDFGIEQLPNSNNQNYTIGTPALNSFLTLNESGTVADPGPLSGSDPEDGTLGSGDTVAITSVPTNNEQLYYNGKLVTNNTIIIGYNPALLQIKFTDVNEVITSFTYAFIDAAGEEDPTPATYTINMSVDLSSTLSSFTGQTTDAGNMLNWTSYDETSATRFTMQRSPDGVNFTAIGSVAGTGNGTTVNHTFIDKDPLPNTFNYYRLEWTDGSGDVAYSNIVTLNGSSVSIFQGLVPNPFRDEVTIQLTLPQTEAVAVRVLDSRGMLLRQIQYQGIKGSNSIEVNGLSNLPVSIYFIQVVLPDQTFVKKAFNTR
jgi:Secretion system C-terminal sorting domain